MTQEEIQIEREHLIQTRLGILCGAERPTMQQRMIAQEEADEWERRWRERLETPSLFCPAIGDLPRG